MDQKLTRRQLGKLAAALNNPLLARITYRGFFILGAPFIVFALFAHETIAVEAALLALGVCAAAAYFCIWDYARLCRRHKIEPFCMLWLPPPATPAERREDAPEYPDPQNKKDNPPPLASAVNEIFLTYMTCFLAAVALTAALAGESAGLLGIFAISFSLAALMSYTLLAQRLKKKIAQDPARGPAALAALAERQPLPRNLPAVLGALIWLFAVAPLWNLLVLPGWLYPLVSPAPKEMETFFAAPAPVSGDGFYALLGLAAPPDVTDIVAYGRRGVLVPPPPAPPDGFGDMRTMAYFNICRGRKPTEEEEKSGGRQPDGTWISAPPPCFYLDEWTAHLAQNRFRIARLESLYTLEGFSPPQDIKYADRSHDILMDSVRLKSVDMIHKVYSGDAQGAMDDMLAGLRFSRRLMAGAPTLVDYAVARSLYGLFLAPLPHLAAEAPALTAQNRDVILDALYFTDRFPTGEILRVWAAEMHNIDAMLKGQVEEMADQASPALMPVLRPVLRQYAVVARRYVYALHNDAADALRIGDDAARDAALAQLMKDQRESYKLRDLRESLALYPAMVGRILMQGVAMGLELFKIDPAPDRARRAYVLAATAQVAPEDMPAFLAARAQNDALMFDRDGQPLYWKAKSRGICYDLRGEYFPEPAPRCFEAPPPVRNAQTAPADPFYWE